MIELTQSPIVAKVREYLNTEDFVQAIKKNELRDLSLCRDYLYCYDCSLPVFADLSISNPDVNDFNSFIYQVGNTYTVVATLTNTDTGDIEVISDDTMGTFYSTGTLKDLVWGFVLDWRKVALNFGFGNYTFHISIDNPALRGGFEQDFCFRLMPFTCDNADKTVRITTFKNGYIENGFDYRDLSIGDWVDQIRFYGKLTLDEQPIIVDDYIVNPRTKEQIQAQIIDNYNLSLLNINDVRAQSFIKDGLLSNNIRINDYNINNIGTYLNLDLALLSIEKPIPKQINGTWIYQIKLEERNQGTVKRNN